MHEILKTTNRSAEILNRNGASITHDDSIDEHDANSCSTAGEDHTRLDSRMEMAQSTSFAVSSPLNGHTKKLATSLIDDQSESSTPLELLLNRCWKHIDLSRDERVRDDLEKWAMTLKTTNPKRPSSDLQLEDLLLPPKSWLSLATLDIPGWLKRYKFELAIVQQSHGLLSLSAHLKVQCVVSETSRIMTACKDADISAVQQLFAAGRASPFDVDIFGSGLIHYAVRGFAQHCDSQQTVALVNFLAQCGAEPEGCFSEIFKQRDALHFELSTSDSIAAPWMKGARNFGKDHIGFGDWWLRHARHHTRQAFDQDLNAFIDTLNPVELGEFARQQTFGSHEREAAMRNNQCLNVILSICINHCPKDPFDDQGVSAYFSRELKKQADYLPLDPRIFNERRHSYIGSVFGTDQHEVLPALVTLPCCYGSSDQVQIILRRRIAVLKSLYAEGILSRFLAYDPGFSLSHAIWLALNHDKGGRCYRRGREHVERHCLEVLCLLLRSGASGGTDSVDEIPTRLLVRRQGLIQSLVCVAAENRLLSTLRQAFSATGLNDRITIDGWLYLGLPDLFSQGTGTNPSYELPLGWHCWQCKESHDHVCSLCSSHSVNNRVRCIFPDHFVAGSWLLGLGRGILSGTRYLL